MRRLVLLAAAALVVPVLPASPAFAATTTYCVNTTDPACSGPAFTTIAQGLTAANNDGNDSVVLVGPGTYPEAPLTLDGSVEAITLRGAGQGDTVLSAAGSPFAYLSLFEATAEDLTVDMTGGVGSSGDIGVVLGGAGAIHRVTIDGLAGGVDPATDNASGVMVGNAADGLNVVDDSQVLMPVNDSNSRGIRGDGSTLVTDTLISGGMGSQVVTTGGSSTLSRVTIRASYAGVALDGETLNIDNSVIDLGTATNATGLLAANFNNSSDPKTVNADHVTIVGNGPGSRGVWAYAAAAGALQTTTVNLTNSIVRGPATSLLADASNNGSQGGPSTATINVSYTDYQTTGGTIDPSTGAGGVIPGVGNLNVDPGFVSASDFRLTPGSPVVDKGDPAAAGPATDLAGAARVVDGDAVPGARRDMGAYELQDSIAPDTTIIGGPAGLTNDSTPTFAFSSEPGATFECKVDAGGFVPCTSPFTTATLADGQHVFSVRATDAAANTDGSPATRIVAVDTIAPETTITKKPAKRFTKTKAKLVFVSEAGARFECQVDGKAWKPCTSPLKLRVKVGKHVALVRAIDAAGNVDATPAKAKFRRLPRQS